MPDPVTSVAAFAEAERWDAIARQSHPSDPANPLARRETNWWLWPRQPP